MRPRTRVRGARRRADRAAGRPESADPDARARLPPADELEFRPAKAARDGEDYPPGTIPDGFYLCGDERNPRLDFQRAVIAGVRAVTHIAPADPDGTIIGSQVVDEGVILYDYQALGLCGGVTNAAYTTTTEVYPDSASATDEECNLAQVRSVTSALEFALAQRGGA